MPNNRKKRSRSGNLKTYPIGASHTLCIKLSSENRASWSIEGRSTGRTVLRFSEIAHAITPFQDVQWGACSGREITFGNFSSGLEAIALYFHEVGHHVNGLCWSKKPTAKEEWRDERKAWFYSLRTIRIIEAAIGDKLITKRTKVALLRKIHDCLDTYRPLV
jgi:hypothetical protein